MDRKDIPGHPGYMAEPDGTIFGKRRENKLHQSVDKFGRPTVCLLMKKGVYRKYQVSRLIAETFLPNPNGYWFVLHMDGDNLNNHVDNLKWCDVLK